MALTEFALVVIAIAAALYAYLRFGRLQLRSELAETALRSIHDAVITTDLSNRVAYLNPMAEQLTGWSWREAHGQPLAQVLHLARDDTDAPPPHPALMRLLDAPMADLEGHTVLVRRDGLAIPIENSAAPIRGAANKVLGNVIIFRDVTETRSLARQLEWRATHDLVTGLENRHSLEQAIDSALAAGEQSHVLVYLDLDHFSVLNDTHGRAVGDELLRKIATALRQRVRRSDRVARLGNDEFGILLHDCTLPVAHEIAAAMCEQIRACRLTSKDSRITVSASAGLVPLSRAHQGAAESLALGDAACNVAKDNGGDRIQEFFGGKACTRKHKEMQWLQRIDRAIAENRFQLFFQSIVPLTAAVNTTQHELLLRMLDDDGSLIPPASFIPSAEKYGMMTQVDRWVVDFALRWLDEHPAWSGHRHTWSINLSGQSLSDDRFLTFLCDALDRFRGDAHGLCFEITETAAIANMQRAQSLIAELKRRGCGVALDDFGAGMSSYTYLKRLPVDFIKIDGAFVKDLVNDATSRVMVDSINRIGHSVGLKTIAECVEDARIEGVLRELGIDYAQGYGIHRPQPLAQFPA